MCISLTNEPEMFLPKVKPTKLIPVKAFLGSSESSWTLLVSAVVVSAQFHIYERVGACFSHLSLRPRACLHAGLMYVPSLFLSLLHSSLLCVCRLWRFVIMGSSAGCFLFPVQTTRFFRPVSDRKMCFVFGAEHLKRVVCKTWGVWITKWFSVDVRIRCSCP